MHENADDIKMIEKVQEITLLLTKHLKGELSSDEQKKLDAWVNESEQNRAVFLRISDEQAVADQLKDYYNLLPQIEEIRKRRSAEAARVINMFSKKTMWPRYVAAASVILLLSIAGYYYFNKEKTSQVATTSTTTIPADIPPAGNKATLTLGNGLVILLDSANNGVIAQQGKTTINKKQDGQLEYNSSAIDPSPVVYNTVSTPRGGKYQLILPDGSKVWLNAASSIRFPTQFTGHVRKVELNGEAYFEVAKDKTRPFEVTYGEKGEQGEIEVLGTHFNVNAYPDESFVNTTLLEGSIRLNQFADTRILSPGQQAISSKDAHKLNVTNKEDAASAVAWVKGVIHFEKADIKTVMRQLSRIYDIDVVYEGNIPEEKIMGDAESNIPLSRVLMHLDRMTTFHFQVQGRTVKVMQ